MQKKKRITFNGAAYYCPRNLFILLSWHYHRAQTMPENTPPFFTLGISRSEMGVSNLGSGDTCGPGALQGSHQQHPPPRGINVLKGVQLEEYTHMKQYSHKAKGHLNDSRRVELQFWKRAAAPVLRTMQRTDP